MSLTPHLPSVPSVPPRVAGADAFADALVRSLRRYGAPAHRLELAMEAFAAGLGLRGAWHVLPTSILASTSAGRVTLVDVAQEDTDLSRLVAVDEVAQAVAGRRMTPEAGLRALSAIEAAPSHVGPALDALGWAAGSASAALFFGGGALEAAVAAGIGLAAFAVAKVGRLARNALVEVVAATLAAVAVRAVPGVAAEPALLGGLVALYPGLRLTTGMTDLATGHLVSGSGGLLSAGVTLLQLGFGVALGTKLGAAWFAAPVAVSPASVPLAELLGLVVGAFAFAVLLRARWAHVPQIGLACAVAFFGERAGAAWLSPELGGGAAAFALTAGSNALARGLDRPAAVTQVPGIWLLVPGSLGFRAVQALMAQDVVHGVGAAFSTALSAMALVAGTLLANAVIAPRRTL
jgi:uncharacterized membrane protein YjjP (DUF1212 family)